MRGPRFTGRHPIAVAACLAAAITSVSSLALGQTAAQASSVSTTPPAQNLLLNGCFTDPAVGTSSYVGIAAGSAEIPHWTIGGGGVQAVGTYWPRSPGCPGSLWLADDNPGFVSQSVPTTPGDHYLLRWESGGTGETESPTPLRVLWGGVAVAVQGTPKVAWQSGQAIVTATRATTTVEFAAMAGGDGPTIGSASLAPLLTVNGFVAAGLTGPYGTAEASMLKHLPSVAKVPSAAPVCTIKASAAKQVNSGAGLQLVWAIAPTAAYLKDSAAVRATAAQAVDQYLTNLTARSLSLYSAALQAERVPETGPMTWRTRGRSRSSPLVRPARR